MNDFQEIEKLWLEFYKLPFPSDLAGKEINGIDVASLDTFTAGCIDAFIDKKDSSDRNGKSVLEECRRDLEIVIKGLNAEPKNYFENLLIITDKIVRQKR